MTFMLGTHQPNMLAAPGTEDVTWFVSRARLVGRVEFPRAVGRVCQDSSGFTQLSLHGRWTISNRRLANETRIYADEIGNFLWASPEDWMCEPQILKKTGKTIPEHQELTIDSVLELRSIAPEIHWIPVLQGWTKDDYLRHLDRYAERGIDLTREHTVGLGSVCRRQGTTEFVSIVRALVANGLSLHGFGVKTLGLRQVAPLLRSADSMAWSFEARRLQRPGLPRCIGGGHKNCANCLPYALEWRRRLLATLPPSWGGNSNELQPWLRDQEAR
jgi:hypothetical protein